MEQDILSNTKQGNSKMNLLTATLSYLKHYPEIDELNYFVDILKYIRKEFNIEF